MATVTSQTNTCKKCGQTKPWAEFIPAKTCRSGYQNTCLECKRAYDKEYRERNKDKISAQQKFRYRTDEQFRNTVIERAKANHERNREARLGRMREYGTEYYRENREQIRQYHAQRYQENRESLLAASAKWKRENPEAVRAMFHRRQARENAAMDEFDRALSVEYRKAIKDDPCAYCGERAEAMHDDHVIPLSRGGTDHWWNLARACAHCNVSKNARTPDEWMGVN